MAESRENNKDINLVPGMVPVFDDEVAAMKVLVAGN